MAGVHLQKLIIDHTPAETDQGHIEVVCFTNPHIPDRTRSLQEDGGRKYVSAIVGSIEVLERADVDCVLIPCNTAHARLSEIQGLVKIPVVNMVALALAKAKAMGASRIGILGTDGTIASGVFSSDKGLVVVVPDPDVQAEVMKAIYAIKAGHADDDDIRARIEGFIDVLRNKGADRIVLGCTELSLYASRLSDKEVSIDPLAELAKEAVRLALSSKATMERQ